ncbi:MAG: hypothetical protein NC341_04075 [Blautia sp.]|nr:hypothetical protein [Blautia sp.]MCM1200775.1 hypothetical protein [Bacteroides fragilis]
MKKKIPVVLGTEENYIFPTFVVISSMLQCAYGNTKYDIYIQTTEVCRERCMNMVQYLYNKYQNFDFHLLIMNQSLFENAKVTNAHVKLPTYYRLMIAEQLLQYDRCIVLDSDILVQDDLTELYDWEINENYVAGVKSWEDQQPTQINHAHMVSNGLPSMNNYIYLGVLLMNLKQIRQDHITDEFMIHMNKGYKSDDQDVINICCYGKISFLPLRYNLLVRHYKEEFPEGMQIYSDEEIHNAWEYPAIIHYPGRLIKPWKNNRVKLGMEWWRAARIFDETKEYRSLKNSMDVWTRKLDFEYIEEHMAEGSKVILFGFSDIGKKVYAMLAKTERYKIIGFCDNDIKKQGQQYKQLCVYSIDEVTNNQEQSDYHFIITSQRSAKKIKEQLLKRNVNEDKIFIYTDLNWQYYASIENIDSPGEEL